MKLYIPSYLGDIQLISEGQKTLLLYSELTAREKANLVLFLKHYKTKFQFKEFDQQMNKDVGSGYLIPEDISKVTKQFLKVFKKDRPMMNVVKLHDGKITLTQEFNVPETEVAVTVEKPPRGCPMPTLLERAEQRAFEVLRQFLNPQQLVDFEDKKAFIVKGNDTGHPYMVISRWNPLCQTYGLLYDVLEKKRVCASLPNVPPSEEVLAMKFAVEFCEKAFINAPAIGGWINNW